MFSLGLAFPGLGRSITSLNYPGIIYCHLVDELYSSGSTTMNEWTESGLTSVGHVFPVCALSAQCVNISGNKSVRFEYKRFTCIPIWELFDMSTYSITIMFIVFYGYRV